MSGELQQEPVSSKKPFPIAAATTSTLIGLANLAGNTKLVSTLTDVRPSSPWSEWLYRWPGSFFKASPYLGKVGDTALSVGLVAATFSHTERDEGIGRTLKLAAAGHALGCAATRAGAVVNLVPSEHMNDLDVGSSSATAMLAGNWATRFLREYFPTPKARAIALGGGTLAIAALWAVDPSITELFGHAIPFAGGVWAGGRMPLASAETVPVTPAAA